MILTQVSLNMVFGMNIREAIEKGGCHVANTKNNPPATSLICNEMVLHLNILVCALILLSSTKHTKILQGLITAINYVICIYY